MAILRHPRFIVQWCRDVDGERKLLTPRFVIGQLVTWDVPTNTHPATKLDSFRGRALRVTHIERIVNSAPHVRIDCCDESGHRCYGNQAFFLPFVKGGAA